METAPPPSGLVKEILAMDKLFHIKPVDWIYLRFSKLSLKYNKNIAEGTRGPFYTIDRSALPTAETLRRRRRRRRRKKNMIPKAQHRFCTMV